MPMDPESLYRQLGRLLETIPDFFSGNIAEPVAAGHCCDLCNAELVIPERLRRMQERDAKREGNGGTLLRHNRSDRWLRSRIWGSEWVSRRRRQAAERRRDDWR